MITRKLRNYCRDNDIKPRYLMRYSKGFIYHINDRAIWATNGGR